MTRTIALRTLRNKTKARWSRTIRSHRTAAASQTSRSNVRPVEGV